MILIKIIAPLLILILTSLQYLMDHKFSDKRTKIYKRFSAWYPWLISIAAIFTIVSMIVDNNEFTELKEHIINIENSAKSDSIKTNQNQLILEDKIDSLNSNLLPFTTLAKRNYPNLDLPTALILLSQDMVKLKEKTNYIEHRREYIPLENDIKNKLFNELQNLMPENDTLAFFIQCYEGNTNRNYFTADLRNLLIDIHRMKVTYQKKFIYNGSSNISFIGYNMDCELTNKLAKTILKNVFNISDPKKESIKNVWIKCDKSGPKQFVFGIWGEPYFNPDGTLHF